MACYFPLKGWRSRHVNVATGKRSIVFDKAAGFDDLEIEVPCGRCIGCRLERSRQWAMRCLHEASLYDSNCFITLTYDPRFVPADGSLSVREWQLFMKRLRKAFPDTKIRFFHCGEYGEKFGRPHYHACLFNIDFDDKVLYKHENGIRLYNSPTLESIWGKGFCTIGEVNFETAAYVARYIMKKVTGEKADDHYQGKQPEYTTMSRRPGIGMGWYDQFKDDLFPSDFTIVNGKKVSIPKAYDRKYELEAPDAFRLVKNKRKYSAQANLTNSTLRRLQDRETCTRARVKQLKRSFESD